MATPWSRYSSSLGANELIFWSGDRDAEFNCDPILGGEAQEESLNDIYGVSDIDHGNAFDVCETEYGMSRRPSAYVDLFETMAKTVVTHESHLLSASELDVFKKFARMSYNARYLLIRLSLRKFNKWHRLSSLKYQSEMGDTDCISAAIHELSSDGNTEAGKKMVEEAEKVVVDLTLDDDDEAIPLLFATDSPRVMMQGMGSEQLKAGPSRRPMSAGPRVTLANHSPFNSPDTLAIEHNSDPEADLTAFADDESKMSLYELLNSLTTDELKCQARQIKIKATQDRSTLISAFLTSSSTQMTIPFVSESKYKGKGRQTVSSSPVRSKRGLRTQAEQLREVILSIVGKCIRINAGIIRLFKRVNLIYFRSTEYTETLLTSALLTRFRKRFYPSYEYTRTADIWRTRDDLLAYEEALELEALVGGMIDGTSAFGQINTASPATPRLNMGASTVTKEEAIPVDTEGGNEAEMKLESAKVQNARRVRDIFVRYIYPRWKELAQTRVAADGETVQWLDGEPDISERKGNFGRQGNDSGCQMDASRGEFEGSAHLTRSSRDTALERFDCGHVYTRMVHRCSRVLATLKEYAFELEVLEALLGQRRWQKGRRGRWHERRALILMWYCGKGEAAMRRAMEAVLKGLDDDDTHIVYRPMLVRRLVCIEKKLKIPPGERHRCEGKLLKSEEIYMEGVRVRKMSEDFVASFPNGKGSATPVTPEPVNKAWGSLTPMSAKSDNTSAEGRARGPVTRGTVQGWWKGKSIWRGRNQEEVNVEVFALQHYEDRGYKGFHSEGSIVRTLFGLLFFDIIFAPIPGAFETPYQSAPLDIAEDAFYYARKDLIEARLVEIEAGAAPDIVDRIDTEHREKGTWCVGVRWDLFGRRDLLEVVQSLGGEPLAAICRLLCEDYAARGAGVPDLLVWNANSRECKFVEVKGPGDSLQENQKVWINVLLRSGVPVEVCHVCEKGKNVKQRTTKQAGMDAKRGKWRQAVSDIEDESPSKKKRRVVRT